MPELMEDPKLTRFVERNKLLKSELRGSSADERLSDARLQINLQEFCAKVALRDCPLEARGVRCFNCRPLLVTARSRVATHYATFQVRPKGVQ